MHQNSAWCMISHHRPWIQSSHFRPRIAPIVPLTSLSKFALVNSKEFRSALVAASFTLLLGSSFLIPWMIAVRISLDLSWSCSGSWKKCWQSYLPAEQLPLYFKVSKVGSQILQAEIVMTLRPEAFCSLGPPELKYGRFVHLHILTASDTEKRSLNWGRFQVFKS